MFGIWCILLTLRMTACGLEILEYDSHEVICSQGLSECTMEDEMPLIVAEDNSVHVQNLTPYFKLCCRDGESCTLCLLIDTEINIHPDKGPSDKEDHRDGTKRNPKASVTVCYMTASIVPTCKRVEFVVSHAALTHNKQFSMVITEPIGVSYSSYVSVYTLKPSSLRQEVVAPSLGEVCSKKLVAECHVPRVISGINKELRQVELQFVDNNEGLPSMCIQHEQNGICQTWTRMAIPLYSVTPCMCFQVWTEDKQRRSLNCPFLDKDFLQKNVWDNVSVSVGQGQMSIYGTTMLSWNVSAPCRLEGDVWPCHHKADTCREMKGFRQQLANGTWRQNSKGHWEKTGVFEEINLQRSPCVMLKIKEMGLGLGPFCFEKTNRWHWSPLVLGGMLLLCLTVLVFYLLRPFVKKWVWSWRHGGFVKIDRKGHLVLLGPPDVDNHVSELINQLGSQLCNHGFSVSVDQWSRKEQCILGPLPWLHSQLLELNSLGGRVVLVLNHNALERAEEWTKQNKYVINTKGGHEGLPRICSPYSDMFTASLFLIHSEKQLGRAGERFTLVTFDFHPSYQRLPEPLQGLPLFQLPSYTKVLLSELTVGRRESSRRTWTGWKLNASDGWRARTKEGPEQEKASQCK